MNESLEQLGGAIATYNLTIWPMQVVAYLLGIAALILVVKKTRYSSRIIAAILASFWLWTGIVFWLPSGRAFPPAYGFAILLIIQGILFLVGVVKPSVSFGCSPEVFSITGILLALYAMLGYPILGYFVGHKYPQSASFGVFPCPAAIFTFALLLCTDKKVPKYLLVIPFLWSLTGFLWVSAGMVEDIGLIIAGLLGTGMIVYRDRKVIAMETQRQASGHA